MSKNQIVKVTRARQDLKVKLDLIDSNIESGRGLDVFKGFYQSRLRIEMGQWTKGKVIAQYLRGVNPEVDNPPLTGEACKLARATGRNDTSITRWFNIYDKHPDKRAYRKLAEEKAQNWTEDVFNKMKALAEDDKNQKQLPESRMKSYIKGITNLLDDDFGFTDELKELYQRLCKKYKH